MRVRLTAGIRLRVGGMRLRGEGLRGTQKWKVGGLGHCDGIFVALRARGFFFVCCLGRLRGGRQGGAGYGAAPPSRPPLHPPRSTPRQVFNYLMATRAARPLLRELPSLRSGDLPARRAIPSFTFALLGRCGRTGIGPSQWRQVALWLEKNGTDSYQRCALSSVVGIDRSRTPVSTIARFRLECEPERFSDRQGQCRERPFRDTTIFPVSVTAIT